MKKNRGIAVIPLIIVLVLVGVAGFSIFSWVKTSKQAQADKEVAEQREQEFKVALDDALQEAEDNAAQAAELDEKLRQTEEAMALAEEKATKDAEEKAAMIADLEEKFAAEEVAKKEAEEKSANLSEEIAELEEGIASAKEREYALRASMGAPVLRVNPRATAGLAGVTTSLSSQKNGLAAIKALLASGEELKTSELRALIASFEDGVIAAEKSTSGLKTDLVNSGEFSSSSAVGQAVADLQQTTRKQRAVLNSLKRLIAESGETIDPSQVAGMIADLESSIAELEDRQGSLDSVVNMEASAGTGVSAELASFQRTISKAKADLAAMKRQLAAAEAEKNTAIERQKELERLSIEIRYDIDYQARSFSYARRLHSMYDQIANPDEEK